MDKHVHQQKYFQMLCLLKAARLKKGLTQAQVNSRVGAYASYISKIESGERSIDPIELVELLRLYGVRIPAFFKSLNIHK